METDQTDRALDRSTRPASETLSRESYEQLLEDIRAAFAGPDLTAYRSRIQESNRELADRYEATQHETRSNPSADRVDVAG